MKRFKEHIARGIVYQKEKILLCENIAGSYFFLPGGHVKENESSEEALKREFLEESGSTVISTEYIDSFYNQFKNTNRLIDETLDVYLVKIKDSIVKSKEDHIRFSWVLFRDLINVRFLPDNLILNVTSIVEKRKDFWK